MQLSSNREIFDESKYQYEKALKESGYNEKLAYEPIIEKRLEKKRKRYRKVVVTS